LLTAKPKNATAIVRDLTTFQAIQGREHRAIYTRRSLFEMMVARAYERGGALNTATHFEIDDVIDPADRNNA
jgi:hypothetical protein